MTTVSILMLPEDAMRRGDAVAHGVELIEPRERLEAIAAQRVEAHRDPAEAGRLERVDLIGEQHAVRGEREIVEPGFAASIRTSDGRSRRSSGSPPVRRTLSTPSERKTSTSALDLLEVQHVLARQPDVVVLRHAVFAAQVAAVGDRQPQVAQRASEESSIQSSISGFRFHDGTQSAAQHSESGSCRE